MVHGVASKRSIATLLRRALRWLLGLAVAVLIVVIGLMAVWRFAPPISTLMAARYLTGRPVLRVWAPLPQISSNLVAALIASEDGQFCRHHGVDWGALREVLDDADENGPSRGASTLTMQVAKNLFLWPSRSAIRKALEIPLALGLDRFWGKPRVLEVYLNIAEWGDGLFGAEAAARHYFRKPASDLTPREAALLVSALPNPALRNPAQPGPMQRRVVGVIERRAARQALWRACIP